MDILCEEFGSEIVCKSMGYRDNYKNFKKSNPVLISDVFNTLSYKWQVGKAREYLESLEEWLRCCLICHLAEDYVNDKSRLDSGLL